MSDDDKPVRRRRLPEGEAVTNPGTPITRLDEMEKTAVMSADTLKQALEAERNAPSVPPLPPPFSAPRAPLPPTGETPIAAVERTQVGPGPVRAAPQRAPPVAERRLITAERRIISAERPAVETQRPDATGERPSPLAQRRQITTERRIIGERPSDDAEHRPISERRQIPSTQGPDATLEQFPSVSTPRHFVTTSPDVTDERPRVTLDGPAPMQPTDFHDTTFVPPAHTLPPGTGTEPLRVFGKPASTLRLSLAYLVDGLLWLGCTVSIHGALSSTLRHAMTSPTQFLDTLATEIQTSPMTMALGLIASLAIGLTYTAFFATKAKGRTIGRLFLGLRLVTRSGVPPSGLRATVRAFLSLFSVLLSGAGYWLGLVDRKSQALHDKVCSTFVVRFESSET